MTETSLRLSEDAVDLNGVARMDYLPSGPANDNPAIAPWIDVPVSISRPYTIHKAKISSL